MHGRVLLLLLANLTIAATGCTPTGSGTTPGVAPPTAQTPATQTPTTKSPTTPSPLAKTPRPSSASRPTPAERTGPDDPRWQFFVEDKNRYRSPWFDGAQRIMIGYGCTRAPFYVPDPRCRGNNGFHHGIDVALPCGTVLRAGVAGRVIDPDRPGRPGPAYGSTAFRLRVRVEGASHDVLIGHSTRVLVRPGDRVRPGQPIALAGARGSPDGCHLHFEQRRPEGGVSSARDPARLLALRSG